MKRLVWCAALVAALVDVGPLTSRVCAQTPAVKVVSQTAATKTMQALKDGQTVNVERRTVRIALALPSGKEIPAYVLMVREPQSGLYWWTYQAAPATTTTDTSDEPPLNYSLYFTADKAVGFAFARPFLGIREILGTKPDFTAIQQTALAEIERNARAIQDGSMRWAREVSVTGRVGRDFLYLAGSASPFPRPRIAGISRAGGQWEVALEGPNKDTARITLDDQYAVVNVRREPQDGRLPR